MTVKICDIWSKGWIKWIRGIKGIRGWIPEEFLDWLATLEEILEFEGVLDAKWVQLVATRLRGRATTWWQQVKLTYSRMGKQLEAGHRSVDDYTNEFYQLVAHNELQETEDQLVARYIGGLRVQLQDTVNLFDPVNVSSAHQRALIVERQQKRAGSGVFGGGVTVVGTGGAVRAGGSSAVPGRPTRPANIGPSNSGAKCFKCGEPGHRQSKAADEELLRNNILQSTYTIGNKICHFMIDSGSCENIVSAEAVQKLSLRSEPHPKSYKLAWPKKGGEVSVSKSALVTFSIGSRYKDSMWCDVVMMDTCNLLLGRPCQFDRSVSHDGRTNKYSFTHKGLKIVLVPNRDRDTIEPEPANPVTATNLSSLARFQEELHDVEFMFALVGREVVEEGLTSCESLPILKEFQDVFPKELSNGLLPLRHIQHYIDLQPGAALLNIPHYRMSSAEHEELRRQLSGARIFTKLDLKSGYHRIQIRVGDEWKTAFKTREGSYEWLSNAPSTFMRVMNQILQPFIGRCVIVYFDDILIYSADPEQHLAHLREVLSISRREKLYAALKKCVFMRSEVLFLGYVVAADGLRVDSSKVEAVRQWPRPTSITEVRSFHGLASFYRRFIPHFSSIMAPLTDCMKGGKFEWTNGAEMAFQKFKKRLTTATILVLLNFQQPFELHSDASKVGIGAVLSQNNRPIAFFSEKLTRAKVRYNTYDVEFYAVVQAHKSGVTNRVVDALSCRRSILSKMTIEEVYRLHGPPVSIVSDRDTRFLSHFWRSLWKMVVYSVTPRGPLDLLPVPDKTRVHGKAADFVHGLQEIHETVQNNLKNAAMKYKVVADRRRSMWSLRLAILFGLSLRRIDFLLVIARMMTIRGRILSIQGRMMWENTWQVGT
ncbi:hypothetical protein CRG98_040991 [Punica granatum]|uniref:Reverse transcriptase domain-containing protein n=1 Tax=Punica granatum TaxID=22663 RepID=A0A2I0I3K9_PUNGR|nr:hypothetical protein CRG98_040991 [Punica granatum]